MTELNPLTGCPTNNQRADWADEAIETFRALTGVDKESAYGDLISDLLHAAERNGQEALSVVSNGLSHWYAEKHADDDDPLGPEADIDITVSPSERNGEVDLPTYEI